MDILKLTPDIESTFFDPQFLTLIESHLTYFRNTEGLNVLQVTPHQGLKFEGDFFGLLDDLLIDKKYHHIVMRVNDYASSADYKGDIDSILLPSITAIELLKNIFQTSEDNSD